LSVPKYIIITVFLAALTTYLLAPAAVEDRISEFTASADSCPEEVDSFLDGHVTYVNDSNVDARLERSNTSNFATSTRNLRCDSGADEGQNLEHYYCTSTTEDLIVEYTELDEDGTIISQKNLLLPFIELDEDGNYIDYSCEVTA